MPFDHARVSGETTSEASSADSLPVAILWADPYSPNFRELHEVLNRHALGLSTSGADVNGPSLRYILRWRAPQADQTQSSPALLAGYGATLDMKKVDYLVIDDRRLKESAVSETLKADMAATTPLHADLSERRWLDELIGTTVEDEQEALGSLNEGEITGETCTKS